MDFRILCEIIEYALHYTSARAGQGRLVCLPRKPYCGLQGFAGFYTEPGRLPQQFFFIFYPEE